MMRRFGLASALLVLCSTAPAMAGTASDTTGLVVTATVPTTCLITASSLSFGTYDPIATNYATDLTVNGSVSTTCTNGGTGTIRLGQGANSASGSSDAAPLRQMASGTNVLTYQLYQSDGTTPWGNTTGTGVQVTGTGSAVASTIVGKIPKAQINMKSGTYTDTVVAYIDF